MKTKAEATEAANRMLARIRTEYPGFRIYVWENLGWHFSVDNGHISVTDNSYEGKPCYTAAFIPHNCYYGDVQRAKTAVQAIKQLMLMMRKFVADHNDLLYTMELELNSKKKI